MLSDKEKKERHRKAVSLYNSKNKEKIKKYQQEWYLENQGIIQEKSKLYYLQNLEHARKYQNAYYLENKGKVKKYQAKYRSDAKKEGGIKKKVGIKNENLFALYGEANVLEARKRGMNIKRFVAELGVVARVEKKQRLEQGVEH